MQPFVYEALSQRVVFGSGTLARLGEEVERAGISRALILSTAPQAHSALDIASAIGGRAAGVFADAVMHTPVDVTEAALEVAREKGADGVVSIGGGSTIGLGKAIALRTGLTQIAVPTTYAGSEATPILGETRDGRKTTQRTLEVLPEVILYDVDLTLTLPVDMSVTSGINAIAHAVEGLYAKDRNPVTTILAREGIAALIRALPVLVRAPQDADARADALYGAWACGTVLGAVGMALHHKVCHTLGGSFDLPHAQTHTVILPHAVAYNRRAAAAELAPLAETLSTHDPAEGLWAMARDLDAPMTLAELGMAEADLDRAADLLMENPYWNPEPLDREALRGLLDDAYFGRVPGTSLTADKARGGAR